MNSILTTPGNYKNLLAYHKAKCVFDGTNYFTHRFYRAGDRTIGQMQQAARSGKQNIIEGNVDGATSTYSNMHLLNIAMGSLDELKEDFEDFLRVNGLQRWELNSDKCIQTRNVCARHNEPEYYLNAFEKRSAETIANIMIVIIMQCIALTGRLLASRKKQFLENGGKKEELYKARVEYRKSQHYYTYETQQQAHEPEISYGIQDELPF